MSPQQETAKVQITEVEPQPVATAPVTVNVTEQPKAEPAPQPAMPDYSKEFAEMREMHGRLWDRLNAAEDADDVDDDDLSDEGVTEIVPPGGKPKDEPKPAAKEPAKEPVKAGAGKAEPATEGAEDDERHAGGIW